ncbi:MAG: hypothetical protein EAY75_03945 [Bacteroidetes bacterium]|nr:MAG: hypothetical protein EAY75_03945 [Bacteroidota bacterium]
MSASNTTHPLAHQGSVQTQRLPASLPPLLTPIDGRSRQQLMQYLVGIAKEAGFFNHQAIQKAANGSFVPQDNWQTLLEQLTPEHIDALSKQGLVPPHLTLIDLLLKLYEEPQRLLNTNVQHHLHHYYNSVLHLYPAPAQPDTLHAIFELKKHVNPTLLMAGTLLNGATDAQKKSLQYALTHDAVISAAAVSSIQGVFVEPGNPNNLRFAPVANSADGMGAALPAADMRWDAFGNNSWPLASVGFALASPVLRMAQGNRTITVTLEVSGLPPNVTNKALENSFDLSITGAKGWISKGLVSALVAGNSTKPARSALSFSVLLTPKDPAVVDYETALHGSSYLHTVPVLQVLVNNQKAEHGYEFWRNATLDSATIDVEVEDVTELLVTTDAGPAETGKPFFPFGATAPKNAACNINYPEAFEKILKEFTLTVAWKNIPTANLGAYYSAYGLSTNQQFSAFVNFEDGGKWKYAQGQSLFEDDARQNRVFKFVNPDHAPPSLKAVPWVMPTQSEPFALSPGQPVMQKMFNVQRYQPAPYVFQRQQMVQAISAIVQMIRWYSVEAANKSGINLQLNRGFYFKEYRAKLTQAVANFSKSDSASIALPNEPFAPEVKSLRLDYKATSGKVQFNRLSSIALAGTQDALHHYHVGPFGVRHEHRATRLQLQFLQSSATRLLPQYRHSGECYIGIANLHALDEVTLLLQVSEGSANPDSPRTTVNWHVLANNYWRRLGHRELIFDSSDGLMTSGVLRVVVPAEATTVNTWMPEGMIWLRASVAQGNDAVCRMIDVKTNAAIALLTGQGYDMAHYGAALPAGSTNKLVVGNAAIKAVTQPYASFGGRPAEVETAFYTRVSERLRHKQRAITIFDMERLVLQHFPQLYMVKVVPHTQAANTNSAGHTQVVVVPNVLNANAPNQLQPKVDLYTLGLIEQHLEAYSSAWATFNVINPQYQPVRISAQVRLKAGFAFGYYRAQMETALQQFLAPWTSGDAGRFKFGGRVTAAQVVNFLDNLPYVDYIAQLQLFHAPDGVNFSSAVNEVVVSEPAGVLTSANTHTLLPL